MTSLLTLDLSLPTACRVDRVMDGTTMVQRQQLMWDGAAPMYARFVRGRLKDPNDAMVSAVKAHLADRNAAGGAPTLSSIC